MHVFAAYTPVNEKSAPTTPLSGEQSHSSHAHKSHGVRRRSRRPRRREGGRRRIPFGPRPQAERRLHPRFVPVPPPRPEAAARKSLLYRDLQTSRSRDPPPRRSSFSEASSSSASPRSRGSTRATMRRMTTSPPSPPSLSLPPPR
jgi:hypothetical protein